DTESSGNMMYLPLDKLTQGQMSGSGSRSSRSGNQQVDVQTLTDQVLQELRARQDGNTRRSR
ncbi:MAG: protease modulator HflK, partial [Marinobacter sp.]